LLETPFKIIEKSPCMKAQKQTVHFTDKYLLSPQNPILINLIGAGGTGSQVLTGLARMNESLVALGHPGIFVRHFDADVVTVANLGRQLFAKSEIGLYKASVLISRINRFFGTNWKAICEQFCIATAPDLQRSNITISCVDKASTRFEIATILKGQNISNIADDRPIYWMDFGNGLNTGQVLLATVAEVRQPESKKFKPCGHLPCVTDEFKTALANVEDKDLPSCSLAEALHRQDLFINSTLSSFGCSLLWSLFREGMITSRGLFLNLKEFRTQPIPVSKI